MHEPITPPYRIGYGFGYRGDIGVEGASKYHEGIDIAVPVGTPVYAPLAGEVVQVTTTGGAGYSIVLQHDATTRTRDNHLSKIPKYEHGDPVTEGEQIAVSGGKVGAPGAGTSGGPHLHFAVYKLIKGEWTAIDPVPWLAAGHAAGGGATPFTQEEDDMPVIVYEGPNSAAAKKLGDIRTGKAIRTLTAAEGHALRAAEASGAAVFVSLSKAEFDKL